MKSEIDIEILLGRMKKFIEIQEKHPELKHPDPQNLLTFKVAWHVLCWVVERENQSYFGQKADEIVSACKSGKRKRLSCKRLVKAITRDHFAI